MERRAANAHTAHNTHALARTHARARTHFGDFQAQYRTDLPLPLHVNASERCAYGALARLQRRARLGHARAGALLGAMRKLRLALEALRTAVVLVEACAAAAGTRSHSRTMITQTSRLSARRRQDGVVGGAWACTAHGGHEAALSFAQLLLRRCAPRVGGTDALLSLSRAARRRDLAHANQLAVLHLVLERQHGRLGLAVLAGLRARPGRGVLVGCTLLPRLCPPRTGWGQGRGCADAPARGPPG